jgi:DNA primase
MAGRIPPEFIDQVLSRVDIIDVINGRVSLRRAGKEFQACCPFHNEKTPSFTVSREKQFYHCFGCGAHGTAVGFLMEYDRLGFVEAVTELARMVGLEVPRTEGEDRGPDLAPLYATLEEAARFFRQQLRTHPQAPRAVDYLRGRGLSGEIAAEFGLGYAPPGWDNLRAVLGADRHTIERLLQCGLLAERPGSLYDRFRDRIMFPIRDPRGRIIGFGGRTIGPGEPKYLNSPETPLFHKGAELYGLYEARTALRQLERVVIVEGYLDVIALAQFGIRFAMATLGTATTPQHLERLSRTAPEILFCFDGDAAGKAAAGKAMLTALPFARAGREFRFLFLPEGEDPDTLVRKEGKEAFTSRLAAATPLSEFFFARLQAELDTESLDGRARLAEAAQPLLQQVPPGIYRDLLVKRLTELVGLERKQLGLGPSAGTSPTPSPSSRRGKRTPENVSAARLAISLLIQQPALAPLADQVPSDWRGLEQRGIALLATLLETLRVHPTITTAALIERWGEGEVAVFLRRLLTLQPVTAESGMAAEFLGALARLNEQFRNQEGQRLAGRNKPSELTSEEKRQLLQLLQRGHRKPPDGQDVE